MVHVYASHAAIHFGYYPHRSSVPEETRVPQKNGAMNLRIAPGVFMRRNNDCALRGLTLGWLVRWVWRMPFFGVDATNSCHGGGRGAVSVMVLEWESD